MKQNDASRYNWNRRTRLQYRIATAAIIFFGAVQLTGCIYSQEIAHVRRDIEREFPGAEFDREFVLAVGPSFFNTVGWIAERVNDRESRRIGEYLAEISRVKVGVYRTERLPLEGTLQLEELSRFRESGWDVAAKVRDDTELVWVLYRERYDSVRDMFILSLSDDELVIVRIEGNLNRLLEKVVEDEMYATRLLH